MEFQSNTGGAVIDIHVKPAEHPPMDSPLIGAVLEASFLGPLPDDEDMPPHITVGYFEAKNKIGKYVHEDIFNDLIKRNEYTESLYANITRQAMELRDRNTLLRNELNRLKNPVPTEWYPPEIKPIRIGVYQRAYSDGAAPNVLFCWWDGSRFSASCRDKDEAVMFHDIPSEAQDLCWRGVV